MRTNTTLGDLLDAAVLPLPLRKSPAPVTRPPAPQRAPLPKAALAHGAKDLRKANEAQVRIAVAARAAELKKLKAGIAVVKAGIADIETRLTKLEQRLRN